MFDLDRFLRVWMRSQQKHKQICRNSDCLIWGISMEFYSKHEIRNLRKTINSFM